MNRGWLLTTATRTYIHLMGMLDENDRNERGVS